jgi:RecJ-like exonuclease
MSQTCDECGEQEDTCYCEKCRDNYHNRECEQCERIAPEDYGYCPSCDRGDCSSCENPSKENYEAQIKLRDNYADYADYLVEQLEVREMNFLSFDDYIGKDGTNIPAGTPMEKISTVAVEVEELERRLNEAAEKRKAASDFGNEWEGGNEA